jgi:hypothetical protein
MKKQEEKKLRLGKVTVQDLNRDEQKEIRGGFNIGQAGTTDIPQYC